MIGSPQHAVELGDPSSTSTPIPVSPVSASALLWQRKEGDVDVVVARPGQEPLRLRVWIRPVSAAMTAQFGSAQTLLIAGVNRAWRANSDQRRISRAQAALKGTLAEIRERSEALPYLDEDARPAADEALAALRETAAEQADAVANLKEAALETAVRAIANARPERQAEHHEAIVCAGVVGWVTRDEDGAPVWPLGEDGAPAVGRYQRVQLTNNRDDEDPTRGRYHIDILPTATLHELSQAIYDHSSGGAGGRRSLIDFRDDEPGPGGPAVGDERPVGEPAAARAARPDALGDDAALDLPGGVRDPAGEAGSGLAGMAGGADLTGRPSGGDDAIDEGGGGGGVQADGQAVNAGG